MHPTTDASVTTCLADAVQMLLPALEEFLQFEDQDLAATRYAQWVSALEEPLPEHGAGAEATLKVLRDVVIPHRVPLGALGTVGWVTTVPTVVPSVAAFSASIAGAQRWFQQSFNFLEHQALEWLKQLLGLPAAFQGTFDSGGSVANLIALGAARRCA